MSVICREDCRRSANHERRAHRPEVGHDVLDLPLVTGQVAEGGGVLRAEDLGTKPRREAPFPSGAESKCECLRGKDSWIRIDRTKPVSHDGHPAADAHEEP